MKDFIFHEHPEIKDGQHAILSPSQKTLHREKLTEEQLDGLIRKRYAATIGTELHALAADLIKKRTPSNLLTKSSIKLKIFDTLKDANIPRRLIEPELYSDTLLMYIKDAIGFDLKPEVKLVYLYPIAWGTADAIRYNPYNNTLRIHDLKTGTTPASLDQLVEYAAYFFLEYHIKPGDCQTIISIYQNGDILTGYPTASDILPIMDNAISFTKYIKNNYEEAT